MTLTLNDEQEKALREWYHMDSTNAWRPTDAGKGLRLAEAIRPLVAPWGSIFRSRDRVTVDGPHHRIEIRAYEGSEQERGDRNLEFAMKLCTILNASEARK